MRESVVYLVDDDPAVRDGLCALLQVHGHVVRAFESAEALLAALPAQPSGCMVVDVRMPGMNGLELQAELKRRAVGLPVVVITGHGDVPVAVAALKAGAVDFLEKPFDGDALLAAIQEALRRGDPQGRPNLAELAERVAQLTPREREVMDLVVLGHMNKVIAHRLDIAVRTVEIHRARVMQKTGARSLSELVRLALRLEDQA